MDVEDRNAVPEEEQNNTMKVNVRKCFEVEPISVSRGMVGVEKDNCCTPPLN